MINFIRHNQIDIRKWNLCVSQSVNRRIYAFAWYLDEVCPGWDALVEDDYVTVFPLTHHRKFAINYLAQPFFAQQLGVFSTGVITENKVIEFIRAIPRKFRYVDIHLNHMNTVANIEGATSMRMNYELDLSPSFKELSANYAQNTRRNIRKASEQGLILNRNIKVDDLIDLFRENYGKKEGKLQESHYSTLKRLINVAEEKKLGYIRGVSTVEGVLSAAAFFLQDQSRIYFLFAASSPEARENGAMFVLIDRFISDNAENELILDFEGGNDPNLGRFYKGFGSSEVPYPALRISRLSKVAEKGLYFMRNLRK
jgi:hypothetical protein